MSQVLGLASSAIAPAMKIGVSRQMSATCRMLTHSKMVAPLLASDRSDGAERSTKTARRTPIITTMITARYPLRMVRCRSRPDPPATSRTQIGFAGTSRRNQCRIVGMERFLPNRTVPP